VVSGERRVAIISGAHVPCMCLACALHLPMTMSLLTQGDCAASGAWSPGGALHGASNPNPNPNP
jgi:hypothetical protein